MNFNLVKQMSKRAQLVILMAAVTGIAEADTNSVSVTSSSGSSIVSPVGPAPIDPNPIIEKTKPTQDQIDLACERMGHAYRKVNALQLELIEAVTDQSGDLGKALLGAEEAKSDLEQGLKYRDCPKVDTKDAAEFVSIRRDDKESVIQVNSCPHRFYSYRATADSVTILKNTDPIFDGHREDAVLALEKVRALIESDMTAHKYCETKH